MSAYSSYFYCVANSGASVEFYPDVKNFGVVGSYLAAGKELDNTLGDYYGKYIANKADISGGNYSKFYGLGTPYVYFIYPTRSTSKVVDMNKIITTLQEQCTKVFITQNIHSNQFAQVRISDTKIELSKFMGVPGYPAVYLKLNLNDKKYSVDPNAQNIFRIDNKTLQN